MEVTHLSQNTPFVDLETARLLFPQLVQQLLRFLFGWHFPARIGRHVDADNATRQIFRDALRQIGDHRTDSET